MVKRIISIVVILLLLVTLAIYETITVFNINKKMALDINNLYEETLTHQDNIKDVQQDVKEVRDRWNKNRLIMCTFFSHRDLIYISESLNRLYGSVENNDYDNSIIEINLLREYIKTIKQITEFNLQNLF